MSKFSTLNESHLHKSLKVFYATRCNGKTEFPVENWICDIACPGNSIIEIQTKNVSSLHDKLKGLLALGKKVTVVHPIIVQKIICTYHADGTLLSRRKSPKKESVYSMLRELTGIHDIILHKNFTLVCPLITVQEKRVQTETSVQTKNGRRRFRKNWLKSDKALLTIFEEYKFHGKKAYLSLLPKGLPTEFCTKDAAAALNAKDKRTTPYAGLLLWLLNKMGLIEKIGKKGNAYYYKITTKNIKAHKEKQNSLESDDTRFQESLTINY